MPRTSSFAACPVVHSVLAVVYPLTYSRACYAFVADFILQQPAVACILQVPIWTGDVIVTAEIHVLTVNALSLVRCSLWLFTVILPHGKNFENSVHDMSNLQDKIIIKHNNSYNSGAHLQYCRLRMCSQISVGLLILYLPLNLLAVASMPVSTGALPCCNVCSDASLLQAGHIITCHNSFRCLHCLSPMTLATPLILTCTGRPLDPSWTWQAISETGMNL